MTLAAGDSDTEASVMGRLAVKNPAGFGSHIRLTKSSSLQFAMSFTLPCLLMKRERPRYAVNRGCWLLRTLYLLVSPRSLQCILSHSHRFSLPSCAMLGGARFEQRRQRVYAVYCSMWVIRHDSAWSGSRTGYSGFMQTRWTPRTEDDEQS